MLTAICRNDGSKDYWFYEEYIEDVMDSVVYVVSDATWAGHHDAIDCDVEDYRDSLQDSDLYLDDNEYYVVKYWDGNHGNNVDVGVSKSQIIDNVLENKYAHGAEYWTFGQMLKTTSDWIDSGFSIR